MHGGGMGGGGYHGGGGSYGGGGYYHGGNVGGGYHTGYHVGFYYGRGYGYGYGYYGGYYPYWGFGLGYWPSYSYGDSYPYSYYPYNYYPYPYNYGVAGYQTSPNVTVVYPQTATASVAETARPVLREYDEFGQEVRPASSGAAPVYLIAFNDRVIRAAQAYWVDGRTLHYVTLDRQEMTASLDSVDRTLSTQLNRERRVQFQLPQ
jgi:hypothetical protein